MAVFDQQSFSHNLGNPMMVMESVCGASGAGSLHTFWTGKNNPSFIVAPVACIESSLTGSADKARCLQYAVFAIDSNMIDAWRERVHAQETAEGMIVLSEVTSYNRIKDASDACRKRNEMMIGFCQKTFFRADVAARLKSWNVRSLLSHYNERALGQRPH